MVTLDAASCLLDLWFAGRLVWFVGLCGFAMVRFLDSGISGYGFHGFVVLVRYGLGL